MEKNTRYLKQIIVVRRDLHMPTGKLAAMVAHAAMSFIVNEVREHDGPFDSWFSPDELRWMCELDPGLEDIGQVSMAKIVCSVADEAELVLVERNAMDAGLTVYRVVDSGYSHNKFGDLAAIAIGPDWPERLEPVTGKLKVYR